MSLSAMAERGVWVWEVITGPGWEVRRVEFIEWRAIDRVNYELRKLGRET